MGANLGHATLALAGAGAPPNYGHDFVTVGAPGNRAALESERYYGSAVAGFPNLGQVNQSYRISRTETTAGQWIDFLNVFWPTADALGYTRIDGRLGGPYITASSTVPGTNPGWHIFPGASDKATTTSFRIAAFYCNWLHNGRPTAPGAVTLGTFTTGAYDNATLTRQPGAQFWIPSLDEWTKAVYYDPNRYGAGQEGYWLYPGMSMVPLIGGPPGSPGAQTSAGNWLPSGQLPPDVGSYPGVMSPWGLLDASGGVSEYTDTRDPTLSTALYVRGTNLGASMIQDRIDRLIPFGSYDGGGWGFRIASAVPSAATSFPALCFIVWRPRAARARGSARDPLTAPSNLPWQPVA